jgi:hypothetical protein
MSGMLEVDDHTARRQNWMVMTQDAAHDLPDVLAHLVAQYPDSIRTDVEGNLLFAAHDSNGSIQSFDRLSLQSMPPTMMKKNVYGRRLCHRCSASKYLLAGANAFRCDY